MLKKILKLIFTAIFYFLGAIIFGLVYFGLILILMLTFGP